MAKLQHIVSFDKRLTQQMKQKKKKRNETKTTNKRKESGKRKIKAMLFTSYEMNFRDIILHRKTCYASSTSISVFPCVFVSGSECLQQTNSYVRYCYYLYLYL